MLGICASGKYKYFDQLMFRQIFTYLNFVFLVFFFFKFLFFQISTCYFIWKKLAICTICMSHLYMPESYPSIVYYVTSTYFCFMLYVNYKLYFSISTKNTYITFTLKEPFFQGEEKNNHESILSCIRIFILIIMKLKKMVSIRFYQSI